MFGFFKEKKLTAHELGSALAQSLNQSVVIDEEERSEVEAAGINPTQWYVEIFFLCGSAVFYSSIEELGESRNGNEIREGFMEVFRRNAKENQNKAELFQIFQARLREYSRLASQRRPGIFDPIPPALIAKFEESNHMAALLATKYAGDYFDAHLESTKIFIREAKLR